VPHQYRGRREVESSQACTNLPSGLPRKARHSNRLAFFFPMRNALLGRPEATFLMMYGGVPGNPPAMERIVAPAS
jgi:hypothetical protein